MDLREVLGKIYQKAKEEFDIQNTPKLHLRQDDENAKDLLGKTAHYSPDDESIVLFIIKHGNITTTIQSNNRVLQSKPCVLPQIIETEVQVETKIQFQIKT